MTRRKFRDAESQIQLEFIYPRTKILFTDLRALLSDKPEKSRLERNIRYILTVYTRVLEDRETDERAWNQIVDDIQQSKIGSNPADSTNSLATTLSAIISLNAEVVTNRLTFTQALFATFSELVKLHDNLLVINQEAKTLLTNPNLQS